jgi:hypothetical protein
MNTLEQIAAMARDHGLTAYVDTTAQAVLVFVPYGEARDLDSDDMPDSVCTCRTIADLQSALSY